MIGITNYLNNSLVFMNSNGIIKQIIGGFHFDKKNEDLYPYPMNGPIGLAVTPWNTFAVTCYKVRIYHFTQLYLLFISCIVTVLSLKQSPPPSCQIHVYIIHILFTYSVSRNLGC